MFEVSLDFAHGCMECDSFLWLYEDNHIACGACGCPSHAPWRLKILTVDGESEFDTAPAVSLDQAFKQCLNALEGLGVSAPILKGFEVGGLYVPID